LHRNSQTKELLVEIQKSDGSFAYQDIIEYIEEGRKKISSNCNSQIQEKAIMVLGLTGTGKTTLVNYLNGVQLQCLRDRVSRKWILEIASNSSSLPCGFKIGHGTVSETIFPAVYTAPGEDFS
jgi:septin family protein